MKHGGKNKKVHAFPSQVTVTSHSKKAKGAFSEDPRVHLAPRLHMILEDLHVNVPTKDPRTGIPPTIYISPDSTV